MLVSSTKKYISNRKVFFSYFITYLIIITILFLVIGSFSYYNIIRAEQEKAKIEMKQAVNRIVEIVEANLRDVLRTQYSFYNDLEISRIRKMEPSFDAKEFMRFLRLSDELSMYTSTSQFLDRITIYFHYNHLFIASDMLDSRPEIFFKLKFPNEHIDYEQWRKQQLQHKQGGFFVTQDSPDGYVNLYYRLPIADEMKGVTVIAGIRVGELIDSLGLINKYNDSIIVLADGEGHILYSNCDIEKAKALIYLTGQNPDNTHVVVDDTTYEWCCGKLDLLDWKANFFVSTDDIHAGSKKTQQTVISVYFIVLISSILLAVMFSKKISDPVISLLRLIDGWDSISNFHADKATKDNHEPFGTMGLDYVLYKVSNMYDDYNRLALRIHHYRKISKEVFYNRLLKGEIIPVSEIKLIGEDSILNFNYYTVALARIISHESKSIDIAMFAASERFSSMQEKGLYFCKTAFDRFAIIICTNEFPDKSEITEMIESFHNKIHLDSLVSLRWAIGDTVTNYDQIFVSYRNAEYALHSYNMDILDSDYIVWYDRVKQNNRLTYNFDDAQRIYTLICNEDCEAAIQAIKGLVDKNKEILEASKGQRNRFVSMLSETTLLIVSKLPDIDVELEREIEGILRQMKRAESINAIIEYMFVVVKKLCLCVSSRNKNRNQRLLDKITTFIDDNYSDPNLSLTTIAQSMRLTENYISSFFKKNKGISIYKYIQQKRMTKAAELLEETNLPIAEIIKQVGYNNINTFYKAFKRHYGMTPKDYKESRQSYKQ